MTAHRHHGGHLDSAVWGLQFKLRVQFLGFRLRGLGGLGVRVGA